MFSKPTKSTINPFELENTENKNPFELSEEDRATIKENDEYMRKMFRIHD